jgi:hypothetical protein
MKTILKFLSVFFAFCFAASCATLGVPASREGILVNDTGETLAGVFLSPAGTDLWREQTLDSALPDGGECIIGVADSYAAYWDVYAFSESGNVYAVYETRIWQSGPIVISYENLVNDSAAAGEAE